MSDLVLINLMWCLTVLACWLSLMLVASKKTVNIELNGKKTIGVNNDT